LRTPQQVTEERELEAACEALAVSRREGRERQALDPVAEFEEAGDQLLGLLGPRPSKSDTSAPALEDVPRSSKNQRAQALGPFDLVERGAQAAIT